DQSDVLFVAQGSPALRIGQLHKTVFDRADGAFVPGRHVVVEVPVLEGKCEADFESGSLTQNPDAALRAALEPSELMAETFGISVVYRDRVVQDGTPSRQCQFLVMTLGMRLLVAFELAS